MPGIITHKKIFNDSLKLLLGKKNRSHLTRSVVALFALPEHMRASLFGLLGPNIFDYIPTPIGKKPYGHPASFELHDKGAPVFIQSMMNHINKEEDKNNEWSALQRAYLYGLLCHMAADETLHPYIFYCSGFPDSAKEINHYREQNLLFQYNMDNYFMYMADDKDELNFSIEDMIPLVKKRRAAGAPIKDLILYSLNENFPELYKKVVWFDKKKDRQNHAETFGWLDIIPPMIIKIQNLKRNYNERVRKITQEIRYRNFFYSDFLVQYQRPRKTEPHYINLHREGWINPAGSSAIRYESVLQLCKTACEKTVNLWEEAENSLYTKPNEIAYIKGLNAYTGSAEEDYESMKRKNPVKLKPY
jgi:hypothetical protein